MEKSTFCRICLTKKVRMCDVVNTDLQEIYESLTGMQFETKDNRPLRVCYICHAQLLTCHKLRSKSLHSEKLFSQVLDSTELKLTLLPNVPPLLTIQLVTHLSIVPMSPDTTDTDGNDDDGDNDDPSFDSVCSTDNVQRITEHIAGPQDVFDNDEVRLEDVKNNVSEADDSILPLNTNHNNGHRTPEDSKNTLCPKTVKVHLSRLESTSTGTTPTKLIFAEQENKAQDPEQVINDSSEVDINKTGYLSSQKRASRGRRQYKCDICGKCFKMKMYLLQHACIHAGIKAYSCDICGNVYDTKHHLAKHMRIHTGIKPYVCYNCGKSFSSKEQLNNHIPIHTREESYKCYTCGQRFEHSLSLLLHNCKQESKIQKHSKNGPEPYKCDTCGKCFPQSDYLLRHIRAHGIKPYSCDLCGASFFFKQTLSRHSVCHDKINESHNDQPFKCDICEKRFTKYSNLLRHVPVHTSEKPFKCKTCGKCFSLSHYLARHIRRPTVKCNK